MKTNLCAITLSALSCLAGAALGQEGTYASGLLHTPRGAAQLGTPEGRRLPVHNLGSSGQDGVEINLRSMVGGGNGIEVGPVLSTAGATLRIRHKGWDGLIYGNHRLISNGNGGGEFTFDFSNLGVTGMQITEYDGNGNVVSDTPVSGGVASRPWVPNFTCPNGGTPVLWVRWVTLCNSCQPVLVVGWMCVTSTGGETGTYSWQGRMIVNPTTGPGSPPLPPIESAIIGVQGMTDLTLNGAEIDTLGVPAWGVGQAHIGEVCDDTDGDGSCDQRRLPVSNLGSSGQDGVALDLGPDAGGFELELARGSCCRGHVTLMKAYDDGGSDARMMLTQQDPTPDGMSASSFAADFSAYGVTGYLVTCYDPSGNPIGEPQGIITGGPAPVWQTFLCPDGATPRFIYDASIQTWIFIGCDIINTARIAFPSGIVYDNIGTFTVQPLTAGAPSSGRIRHVVITKNGTEMELKRVIVRPPNHVPTCGSVDFDGDGDIGTDADIEAFFACLGGACCTTCDPHGADFNGDGDIGTDADIETFFRVLAGGPC